MTKQEFKEKIEKLFNEKWLTNSFNDVIWDTDVKLKIELYSEIDHVTIQVIPLDGNFQVKDMIFTYNYDYAFKIVKLILAGELCIKN